MVSRLAAMRHLRDILNGESGTEDEPDLQAAWALTEDETAGFDPESHIEQKFRQILRERLTSLGASIAEQPGLHGNRFVVTLGGGRVWTLDPQEFVLGCRPDFMLRSNDTSLPEVAIFCDGWKFHASPAINRLADDVTKRQTLRDAGHIVIGLSWQDLDGDAGEPPWLNELMFAPVTAMAAGALTPAVLDLLRRSPIDFLVQWVQQPDPAALESLANWLPMFLLGKAQHNGVAPENTVHQVATDLLAGGALVGEPPSAWAWKHDALVLLARKAGDAPNDIEVGLILDDDEDQLGPDHVDAWRTFLRLSNFLNGRARPTTISVTSLVGAGQGSVGAEDDIDVPEELRQDYALASAAERVLMLALHEAGVRPATFGHESELGIPLSVSWPRLRVTVDLDLTPQDVDDLVEAGWVVVAPDVSAIRDSLIKEGV